MFEADLWNGDSLSSTNFFRFGRCVNIGVQQDSFPAPVLQGKAIFVLKKHIKVSSSSVRWFYTFVIAGGEKSIGKALPLVGFLCYLDLRTNQTHAVLLQKNMDLHSPSFMVSYELITGRLTDTHSDTLTDGRGPIKAHGTSRRLYLFSVIICSYTNLKWCCHYKTALCSAHCFYSVFSVVELFWCASCVCRVSIPSQGTIKVRNTHLYRDLECMLSNDLHNSKVWHFFKHPGQDICKAVITKRPEHV